MIDWAAHKKHRTYVASTEGSWVGLVDKDGTPIMDLPPLIELDAPETRLVPESAKLTMLIRSPQGVMHPVVNHLIAQDFIKVDNQGQLVPLTDETHFIALERPGAPRRMFRVSHAPGEIRGSSMTKLTVHANDLLRMLSLIPAASAPLTWTGEWTRFERDWAGPENIGQVFESPRDLQDIKLATVADGATIEGPAEETIRRLVSESLAAAFKAAGVTDHPIRVVPRTSGKTSRRILIRPTDKTLWDEISPLALAAGVKVSASMWWPEDPQPEGMSLDKPTILVSVVQT